MMLDDAKVHMQTLIELLREYEPTGQEEKYIESASEFLDRFKHWFPEVYAYIDGGCMQGASANCNAVFNLWDNDNEKESESNFYEEGVSNEMDEEDTYEFRHAEWNRMIKEGTKSGELKSIM